jgi:hypothetical protein
MSKPQNPEATKDWHAAVDHLFWMIENKANSTNTQIAIKGLLLARKAEEFFLYKLEVHAQQAGSTNNL